MATLEIVEPTDKDKGMYTIEIVDVEKTHTRTLDLSGQRELLKCIISSFLLSDYSKRYLITVDFKFALTF